MKTGKKYFLFFLVLFACKKDVPVNLNTVQEIYTREFISGKFDGKNLSFENKISARYDTVKNIFDAYFFTPTPQNGFDTIRIAFFNFKLNGIALPFYFFSLQSSVYPYAGLELFKDVNNLSSPAFTLLSTFENSFVVIDSILQNNIITGRFGGVFSTKIKLNHYDYLAEGYSIKVDSGAFRIK